MFLPADKIEAGTLFDAPTGSLWLPTRRLATAYWKLGAGEGARFLSLGGSHSLHFYDGGGFNEDELGLIISDVRLEVDLTSIVKDQDGGMGLLRLTGDKPALLALGFGRFSQPEGFWHDLATPTNCSDAFMGASGVMFKRWQLVTAVRDETVVLITVGDCVNLLCRETAKG